MDPFDDILPHPPVAGARVGGKFMPKARSKQLPQKQIFVSEQATSCGGGKNEEHATSSATSTDMTVPLGTSANKVLKSNLNAPAEPSNLDDTKISELGTSGHVNVNGDNAALVDTLSTIIAASEVNGHWDSTNFPNSTSEKTDPIGLDVGLATNIIPETNLSNIQPLNSVGNELRNVAGPSTTSSNIIGMEEPCKNRDGSFLGDNLRLDSVDTSLHVGQEVGSQSASVCKVAMLASNIHSDSQFERVGQVESAELELDPFSNVLPDPGARNAHKFQPKIKPRPRVTTATAIAAASPDVLMENSVQLTASCPNIEVIPYQPDSLNVMLSEVSVHNGDRDWASSFRKSAGETADIFSGLESLDDFLTQAATDTGKPALHPFNEKGIEENFAIPARSSDNNSSIFEEVVGSNPACTCDADIDSMNSGPDPAFEIQEVSEKEKHGSISSSPRKHKKTSITGEEDKDGKPSRKRTAHKPVDEAEKDDIEDDDYLEPPYNSNREKLEESNDEYEVNHSSKKKRASTSSKKKTVAKNGKPSQRWKRVDEDLEMSTKEPSKKFSHSTRRRKRCVDKALLETPEDELDPRTLRIKDLILLAEHREQLAKKEATTSKRSFINQSGGDSHHEPAAYNEEEILASEDGRCSDDDQENDTIPLASTLFNYQSFMEKAPRGKWSKQDTELFYEAVQQFGTDFSMIQQLFPGRTRHQVKLKYKKEERQHPLRLSDAVKNHAKDHSHFKLLIDRLQQASTKVEEDPIRDTSVGTTGEGMEDLTPETINEVAKPEEVAVKDKKDSAAFQSPENSDDSDDDLHEWFQYKSDY